MADPNRPNPHLPPQWHPIPSTSSSSTASASVASTPLSSPERYPLYPQRALRYPPSHTSQPRSAPQTPRNQFHHYQPPQLQQQMEPPQQGQQQRQEQRQESTSRTGHPITAPFQVPKLPQAWPYPGANPVVLHTRAESAHVPIDPRLFGSGNEDRRREGPAPPDEWSRRGWPPSS